MTTQPSTARFLCLAMLTLLSMAGRVPAQTISAAVRTNASVRLEEDAVSYTLDNGLVRARIIKRGGVLKSLRYRGLEMLAQDLGGANGGYWSSVGRVTPGSHQLAVLRSDPRTNGGTRAEISCSSVNDPASPEGNVAIDIRYALGRGDHWLYTYAVWTHAAGWPPLGVGEARYALKLNPEVFDYMTIDAERRRVMPTGEDWDRGEPLNVKEARRMTTGRYAGQPEHKYGYSALLYQTPAYGWSSTQEHVGLWLVNPSMEYLAGGPTKLELTGHLDVNPHGLPTLLNMWLGSHYGGTSLSVGREESWVKVIGPFLIYCNQAADHDQMWIDALARAASESAAWPYDWVADPAYPLADERARVSGRILLHDPYVPPSQMSNLWVGLTAPDYPGPPLRGGSRESRGFGPLVDWQRDSKQYQFWVRADAEGRFTVPQVRPGNYQLHAFAEGVLGEFTRTNILVTAGQPLSLGELEWTPVRHGRPIWEIGIPNRTAQEFKNGSHAWQWGTYLKYQQEFPSDVIFVMGQSDWRSDWNYVQPPRLLRGELTPVSEDDEEEIPAGSLWRAQVSNTTWSIHFEMPGPVQGQATLRLAFCGTHHGCRVEVLVNGRSVGDTGDLPSTSAMQRDSARAYWTERPIPFEASLLKEGGNTIQLVSHATSWSQGVMYDYLRLELSQSNTPAAFSGWPAGKSPEEIGHSIATNMLPRWIVTKPYVHYAEDSAWVHALQFAELTGDEPLREAFIRRFEPFLEPDGEKLISMERHVDHTIFGIVPLELYIQTGNKRCLEMGRRLADRQWEFPIADGLSGETRFWIDDMYMITILQVQAFRATGDRVYLDRAALEMAAYLDALQRPNGLFYHGPDFPFFWGRGNGWVAAGMTELLRYLPEDHPQRDRVMAGYLKMMSALLAYQGEDGMWHQLIDGPDSYKETSCSAMFTYAMITGVKSGWLPEQPYAPAARNGWLGLAGYIDASGNVDQVCVGTGQTNDRAYYLNRPRRKGDHHGQAPTLWCAVAFLREHAGVALPMPLGLP